MGIALKVGAAVVALGSAGALLLYGSEAPGAVRYAKTVDEVLSRPAEFASRDLRVTGALTPGSIRFRESPCEWRFSIQSAGKDGNAVSNPREMQVRFPQCVVPDTFRDGMGVSVSVEGRLDGVSTDGTAFLATNVVAQCPSKYEMKQRAAAGETMPHAAPAPSM